MSELNISELNSNGSSVKSPSSPHALLLPFPAQGHINPLMQLGKRLAAQGVRVTVANIQHIHAKVGRAQKLAALGNSSLPPAEENFELMPISDGLPPDFDREKYSDETFHVVETTLEEGALELVHTLASQGRPVTCIVSDFFIRWAPSLAKRAAVPEFIFWPQCASVFSIYVHVDAIISSGYDPFENNVRAASSREAPMNLITCIPGLPTEIHPADLPFECPFGKAGLEWMKGLIRTRISHMGDAEGVIGNSFEALEPEVLRALNLKFQKRHERCWPRSIRLVGPLVPMAAMGGEFKDETMSSASLWQEEVDECKQWLDSQPPSSVLFVAFGSITTFTVAQVQELALGLIASDQKFLWAIRENAIRAAPVEDFATGLEESIPLDEALPEGYLEQHKDICKVVQWAPQAMVLSHPSVGGFFSHCGWNSTLESICSGVPLLGWPWLMDQATNCWLASHVWKTGLTLERNQPNKASRMQVEMGVRQVMEGPLSTSLRARARELRDMAREAKEKGEGFLFFVDDILNLAH